MIHRYRDKNIEYDISGSGEPLVLLHGFLETREMWEPVLGILEDRFSVIRIDLPGHGGTENFTDVHSMELMAEVVLSVLSKHEITEFRVIGHSMGGYVALALLESHAGAIKSIVLLNSTTEADSSERLEMRRRALELIPQNPKLYIRSSIKNLFAASNQKQLEKVIKKYQDAALSMDIKGILAATRGMMARPDRTELLKDFKGKKYWISGKEDPIIPVNQGVMLSELTGSTSFMLDGGHMSIEESPAEFVKIVHFIE